MNRYLKLLAVQLRTSLLLSMQYRSDFFIDGFIEVFWTLTQLVPLLVIFHSRRSIAGWTFGEALLVTGWFTLLQGVLEGAINPSLTSVVEHIRKGTLDFILLKPADAQFMVSTARFYPWRAVNVITAVVMFAVGFHDIGHGPEPADLALAAGLLVVAVALLYSMWMLAVCAAFYVVKIDNLTHLFNAIFDAARWPQAVFRGAVRAIFTFVIPLALMTTYPAEAMLGRLSAGPALGATAGAIAFLVLSRLAWVRAIGKYTSASS